MEEWPALVHGPCDETI